MVEAEMLLCPSNASSCESAPFTLQPHLPTEKHLVEGRARLSCCYLSVCLKLFLVGVLLKNLTPLRYHIVWKLTSRNGSLRDKLWLPSWHKTWAWSLESSCATSQLVGKSLSDSTWPLLKHFQGRGTHYLPRDLVPCLSSNCKNNFLPDQDLFPT